MDLVEGGGNALNNAGSRVAQAAMNASVQLVNRTVRVSVTAGREVAHSTIKAMHSMLAELSTAIGPGKSGQVSLRTFAEVAQGKREVVSLDDAAVSREFAKELDRHGVTFSVDKNADGSRTFHVQGKDASVVQHALTQAAAKVDAHLARGRAAEKPTEGEAPAAESIRENPYLNLGEAKPGSGDTEARPERAPSTAEPRETVAQQTPPARAEHQSQLSPRDATRQRNAQRIEASVTAAKDRAGEKVTRTRGQRPTQAPVDRPPTTPRGR